MKKISINLIPERCLRIRTLNGCFGGEKIYTPIWRPGRFQLTYVCEQQRLCAFSVQTRMCLRCSQCDENQNHNRASTRQNLSLGFPTKRCSNQSPQLQRPARKLKFRLKQVRIKANNKGADQTARTRRWSVPLLFANFRRLVF